MQSHSGPARPATLMGSLAAAMAALLRWLSVRISRLFTPRSVQARGQGGAAAGRFYGRFDTPRESLAGTTQPGSGYAGYAGYAKAVAWGVCAGPWARDVATGTLVGGATVGANNPVAAVAVNSPARTGAAGDPR